jgi:hypothetical protein
VEYLRSQPEIEKAIGGKPIKGRGGYGRDIGTNLGSKLGGWLGNAAETLFKSVTGQGPYQELASPVPLVNNSIMGVNTPMAVQIPSMHKNSESTILRKREFVKNVKMTKLFTCESKPITPTNATVFGWMTPIAKQFQQYKILGMIFELKSLSSFTTGSAAGLGSMSMSVRYDVDSNPPVNKAQALNSMFAVSGRPCDNLMCPVECDPNETPNQPLYIQKPHGTITTDKRFTDHCVLDIITEGAVADYEGAAELWVTYEIMLLKPMITDPGAAVLFAHVPLDFSEEAPLQRIDSELGYNDSIGIVDITPTTLSFDHNMSSDSTMILFHLAYSNGTETKMTGAEVASLSNGLVVRDDFTVLETPDTFGNFYSGEFASTAGTSVGVSAAVFMYDGSGTESDPPTVTFNTLTCANPFGGDLYVFMIPKDSTAPEMMKRRTVRHDPRIPELTAGTPKEEEVKLPKPAHRLHFSVKNHEDDDEYRRALGRKTYPSPAVNPTPVPVEHTAAYIAKVEADLKKIKPGDPRYGFLSTSKDCTDDWDTQDEYWTKMEKAVEARKALNGNNGSATNTDDVTSDEQEQLPIMTRSQLNAPTTISPPTPPLPWLTPARLQTGIVQEFKEDANKGWITGVSIDSQQRPVKHIRRIKVNPVGLYCNGQIVRQHMFEKSCEGYVIPGLTLIPVKKPHDTVDTYMWLGHSEQFGKKIRAVMATHGWNAFTIEWLDGVARTGRWTEFVLAADPQVRSEINGVNGEATGDDDRSRLCCFVVCALLLFVHYHLVFNVEWDVLQINGTMGEFTQSDDLAFVECVRLRACASTSHFHKRTSDPFTRAERRKAEQKREEKRVDKPPIFDACPHAIRLCPKSAYHFHRGLSFRDDPPLVLEHNNRRAAEVYEILDEKHVDDINFVPEGNPGAVEPLIREMNRAPPSPELKPQLAPALPPPEVKAGPEVKLPPPAPALIAPVPAAAPYVFDRAAKRSILKEIFQDSRPCPEAKLIVDKRDAYCCQKCTPRGAKDWRPPRWIWRGESKNVFAHSHVLWWAFKRPDSSYILPVVPPAPPFDLPDLAPCRIIHPAAGDLKDPIDPDPALIPPDKLFVLQKVQVYTTTTVRKEGWMSAHLMLCNPSLVCGRGTTFAVNIDQGPTHAEAVHLQDSKPNYLALLGSSFFDQSVRRRYLLLSKMFGGHFDCKIFVYLYLRLLNTASKLTCRQILSRDGSVNSSFVLAVKAAADSFSFANTLMRSDLRAYQSTILHFVQQVLAYEVLAKDCLPVTSEPIFPIAGPLQSVSNQGIRTELGL